MSRDLATAYGIKKTKYANGGQVGLSERKERLKEQLFGRGEMASKDPAEEQMAEALDDKDMFLSDEGDGEEPEMMAEGGIVEHNSARKTRLKGILSENHMKTMKK